MAFAASRFVSSISTRRLNRSRSLPPSNPQPRGTATLVEAVMADVASAPVKEKSALEKEMEALLGATAGACSV